MQLSALDTLVHSGIMESGKGVGSVNQRFSQGVPSSGNLNVGVSESGSSGISRPVLNYSIQTGEEFALEFMRANKKSSSQNTSGDQNIGTNYMDLRHVLGITNMGSESGSDVSLFGLGESQESKEMGKKNFSKQEHKTHLTSSRSTVQVPSDEGSSRGVPHQYSSSNASHVSSTKMKFLCSLGGKILPRPSDSKLRYVGGDTRIIRINKEVTFEELVQKTMAFCKKPHTIKYQLPGEELDALVSVSCDEDLQNMIEECSVLEGIEGSQKLRVFLFTSDDIDDVNFNFGSIDGESEMQYFFAVNGMDLVAGKASSGHGIASDLDQFLNFNVEPGRTKADRVSSESIGILNSFSLPPSSAAVTQAVVSNDFGQNAHHFEDHKAHYGNGKNYAYSDGDPIDGFQILGSSVPLSVPSDYQFKSNYSSKQPVHDKESFHPGVLKGQFGGIDSESLSDSLSSSNLGTLIKETKSTEHIANEEKQRSDHIRSLGTESMQQQEAFAATCVDAEAPATIAETEHARYRLHPISGVQQLETGQVSSSTDTVNPGYSSELKEDDKCSSIGAFPSVVSEHSDEVGELNQSNLSSHPYRCYQSERIRREQPKFFSRLSKSEDSLDSHLMSHDYYSVPEEPATEIVDSFIEGSIVSETDKSSSFAKPPRPTSAITDDGFLKLEKHNPPSKKINLTEQFEPLTSQIASEIARASSQHGNMYVPLSSLDSHKVSDHTDIIGGDLSNNLGIKIQKSELQYGKLSSGGNKLIAHEDPIFHEQNANNHITQTITGELVMPKNKEKGTHADGVDQQKNPASKFSATRLEETSTNDSNTADIAENPTSFPRVVNSFEVVSEKACSAPVSGKQDVSSDINDRLPPDLLSDFLSNTTTACEMLHGDTLLKDDARVSLNFQNYDPKRWSFFRNLAQEEFAYNKVVSLMDQDHIDYSSFLPKVEEGISSPYHFGPVDNEGADYSQIGPQIRYVEEMHQGASSTIIDDSVAVDTSSVSSQIIHPLRLGKGEGFQVDNPFSKLRETLRTHVPEYEDLKIDIEEITELVINTAESDVNFDNLQIIRSEDLEDLRELGSGTFGTVYHGKWRGTDVAIKRIKKSCLPDRSSEQEKLTMEYWREAEILSQLHHPNVVAFYGVVKGGPGATLATVTEFMVNGSLRHVLLRKDKYLDWRKRLIIAMDAAFGMEYLHSKNIVHFDLKCDNLLVNLKDQSRPICKVGDLGLSKIKRNTLVSGGVRGTLPWMAPELLSGSSNKVSEKVDVFSFGIVMWEILTGEEPYANMHYGAIIGGIVNNTLRPPVPITCDPEWRKLMEQCWAPDPLQRPSFTQIAGRLRAMSVASHTKLVK